MLKKIKRFILIPPHWIEIKRIGNSRLAKLTMLMPFIGYMILFNNDVNEYLKLSSKFIEGEDSKDSNRLFYFYFGLSFAGFASLLFQIYCPRRIRLYKDAIESVEYGTVLVSSRRIQRIMQIINDNHKTMRDSGDWIPPQLEDFIERLREFYKSDRLPDVDFLSNHSEFPFHGDLASEYEKQKEFQKQAMFVSWGLSDIIDRKTRLLILALYGLGFLFLVIPTADTFWRVCVAFWDRLFV